MTHRPWVAQTGAALLAAGLAARVFMPDGVQSAAEAIATALLLLGGGLTLLEGAHGGRAPASAWTLALPWLVVPPALHADAEGVKLAVDLFAAAVAGFAVRELVRGGAPMRRVVVALALVVAAFGVAQTLYLNADARAVAAEMGHKLVHTELGRAFLASPRAPATFTSPNSFAGSLLLVLPLFFAGFGSTSRGGGRGVAWAACAVLVVAAFGCAGSAGATLALALASCLCAVRWTAAHTRARTAAVAALVACAGGVVALVVAAVTMSGASGKLATLRERIDYARVGLRLLPDAPPFGIGWHATSSRTAALTRPGEGFSRSLHDWWLEGVVEAGVLFIPFAAALLIAAVRALRTTARGRTAQDGAAADAAGSKALFGGLVAGALIAGLVLPFVTFAPSRWSFDPAVDALILAALVAAACVVARRLPLEGARADRALTLGFVAFLIHGLVDFDLKIAGVATMFAVSCALLPTSSTSEISARASKTSSRAALALSTILGLAAILAPLPLLWLQHPPQ